MDFINEMQNYMAATEGESFGSKFKMIGGKIASGLKSTWQKLAARFKKHKEEPKPAEEGFFSKKNSKKNWQDEAVDYLFAHEAQHKSQFTKSDMALLTAEDDRFMGFLIWTMNETKRNVVWESEIPLMTFKYTNKDKKEVIVAKMRTSWESLTDVMSVGFMTAVLSMPKDKLMEYLDGKHPDEKWSVKISFFYHEIANAVDGMHGDKPTVMPLGAGEFGILD